MENQEPSLLIVDDARANVELCKKVIHKIDPSLRIIVCQSGEEALLELTRSKVILVLCDIVLPGMGGIDVAENVKRMNPAAGVVMMTAYPSVETCTRLLRMGVDDYLEKPLDLLELELALRRSLGKERLIEGQADISNFLSLITNCRLLSSTQDVYKMLSHADCYLLNEFGDCPRAFFNLTEAGQFQMASSMPGKPLGKLSFVAKRIAGETATNVKVYERVEARILRIAFSEDLVWVGQVQELATGWEERVNCLVDHFKTAILTASKLEQAEHLAQVDDVTGLFNVRRLDQALDESIENSNKTALPFSVLFVDLDHFKQINDNRGHLIGSQILVEVGKELERLLREDDLIFRYGGDEFVIILKETNMEVARLVADRLRESLEKKRFLAKEGLDIRVTASIGVATYPDHASNKAEILDVADQAMYSVKKSTRNAVYVANLKS